MPLPPLSQRSCDRPVRKWDRHRPWDRLRSWDRLARATGLQLMGQYCTGFQPSTSCQLRTCPAQVLTLLQSLTRGLPDSDPGGCRPGRPTNRTDWKSIPPGRPSPLEVVPPGSRSHLEVGPPGGSVLPGRRRRCQAVGLDLERGLSSQSVAALSTSVRYAGQSFRGVVRGR